MLHRRTAVDTPTDSVYIARTRAAVTAGSRITIEVVKIRALAPILWNSTASVPRRVRPRFCALRTREVRETENRASVARRNEELDGEPECRRSNS